MADDPQRQPQNLEELTAQIRSKIVQQIVADLARPSLRGQFEKSSGDNYGKYTKGDAFTAAVRPEELLASGSVSDVSGGTGGAAPGGSSGILPGGNAPGGSGGKVSG